jgi:uncharacterized protein
MEVVIIKVLLSPNASNSRVLKWHEEQIKIAISSPPTEGKANKELLVFLAKLLNIAKNRLKIIRGQKSKSKQVEVLGISLEKVQEIFSREIEKN